MAMGKRYPAAVTRAVVKAMQEKGLEPEDVSEWEAQLQEDGTWAVQIRLKPSPTVNIEFVKETE